MFTIFHKKPFFNKEIHEYCIKSIQNTIERIKNQKLITFKNPNINPKPNNILYILLSIPIVYIFYQNKRKILNY